MAHSLVSRRQPHLKWAVLDPLENILMMLCGFTLFAFSTSVVFDIATRIAGRPWLWLQEVTSTFFIYGVFIGAAVATRRNDHLCLTALSETLHGRMRFWVEVITRVVTLVVAVCMVVYGYQNFLRGFGSFRMPSLTPIASLYAAIPISGVLIVLFSLEQIVNGWRNGFDHKDVIEMQAGAAALADAFGQAETVRKST
ncbi:MAG: C4-dicarboxylate ABC transporter permease [Rhizobiales bacterium PAR1]|nr:MAG: C4-dicarboxylate ABC transporter permease [Rhizobiales bacterium PAR1]